MRLLFIPAAGGVGLGPLTNALAIAEEARLAGHELACLCKGPWEATMRDFGFETYVAPLPGSYQGPLPPPFKFSDVIIGLGWADPAYIEATVEAEREAIRAFRADAVISVLHVTVPISAGIERVPWVAIFGWADGPGFSSPLYRPEDAVRGWELNYNRVLERHGLDPIDDISELAYRGARLKVAPTIPELQPELLAIPDVHFAGNLLSNAMEHGELPQEVAEWCAGGPVVYAYLAPGDIAPEHWIPTLVEAYAGTDFRVLVTLAPLDIDPATLPSAPNVRFFKQLPGSTAMAHSDLVISHGGSNSVTNAFLAGAPQMIFPDRYAERDYNGRAVERMSAGMNCTTEQFTPAMLRENSIRLVSDDRFRQNARRVGDRIREFGGSREVVRLIGEIG